jgi:hypothetical protein
VPSCGQDRPPSTALSRLEQRGLVEALSADDRRRTRRPDQFVPAGNEPWNSAFIGRRSARNGVAGAPGFLAPLLALLQKSVAKDPPSPALLTPYPLWVLGYDLPWTYALWRLNPDQRRRP